MSLNFPQNQNRVLSYKHVSETFCKKKSLPHDVLLTGRITKVGLQVSPSPFCKNPPCKVGVITLNSERI